VAVRFYVTNAVTCQRGTMFHFISLRHRENRVFVFSIASARSPA